MTQVTQLNINALKYFLLNGPEAFYLGYYCRGKKYVQQALFTSEIQEVIDNTSNAKSEFEQGLIDQDEMIIKKIKNVLLSAILETEKDETKYIEPKIYQYIADCLFGNIYSMFSMVADCTKHKKVKDETKKEAEKIVFKNIKELLLHSNLADDIKNLH